MLPFLQRPSPHNCRANRVVPRAARNGREAWFPLPRPAKPRKFLDRLKVLLVTSTADHNNHLTLRV